MHIIRAFIIPIITVAIIFLLDRPLDSLPALGRLLDPINGWAANAEATKHKFNEELELTGVQAPVELWMEDRLVPHIRAANNHDLYFVQGYVHAYFRLWQMDFQARAAAGRVSEVVGEKMVKDAKTGQMKNAVLEFDRGQRRKGMVYGAENSLKTMEADPRTKEMLDAYTAGVNSFISSLSFKALPLEYKLMGFKPEAWTNLKTALLLKYMADDLTGYTEDIPLTILRDALPKEEFEYLFPQRLQGSTPVIPEGTVFDPASLPAPQALGNSVWSHFGTARTAMNNLEQEREERSGIGSNNWAVSGANTASGAPILCNDPHLGLNLPSLWFEVQLQAPGINCYGVSLPGAPGIIIGFNDSLSWGFTNNYRDVKDFYEIDAIDKDLYRFDGQPQPFTKRIEVIKIKGKPDVTDTVYYTVHGPMMYDETFIDPSNSGKKLAMCWMAHRGTNELLSVYLLNRAKTYIEFTEAIMHFQCPAQNMVYADRAGNIAMWGQGQFINKWKDQGRYVMKGNTSTTLWGQNIPMTENPHVLNPPQGYVASANQITTDSTYPYWYNGYFYDFRAWSINEKLSNNIRRGAKYTPQTMQLMQNDVYSVLAQRILPALTGPLSNNSSDKEGNIINNLNSWNKQLTANSQQAIYFQLWWDILYKKMWSDSAWMSQANFQPSPERSMQLLNMWEDSSLFFTTFSQMLDSNKKLLQAGNNEWYKVKATQLTHLAKLDAFSYKNLKIGGWGNTINAVKKVHGPSWRMVVEMGRDKINAYGVYPGGQSGNPGSKYYGNFVDSWVEGKYYAINFLPATQKPDAKTFSYTWTIQPE